MSEKKIVAYLDLLAMSSFVRENTEDALKVFNNYFAILNVKLNDSIINPTPAYNNQLENIALNNSVSSFENFIPFSDSIFISSSNPNIFLKQLGTFVLDCFTFTSDVYFNPDNPAKPTEVKFNLAKEIITENIYPSLFRGGIAFGEVVSLQINGIANYNIHKFANLAGKAVVDAVKLEQKVKGPRIVFKKDLVENLNADIIKHIRITEIDNLYELLWPGFYYIIENGESEIIKLMDLLIPAINLWKANSHKSYSEQYFNLIELIVSSTVKLFSDNGFEKIAIDKVKELFTLQGIENKFEVIIKG
jgi:hypothetical protein